MDHSPPGSSVHGILQARILEWVAMPCSRGSSWPGDRTCVSCLLCWQVGSLPLAPPGRPLCIIEMTVKLKMNASEFGLSKALLGAWITVFLSLKRILVLRRLNSYEEKHLSPRRRWGNLPSLFQGCKKFHHWKCIKWLPGSNIHINQEWSFLNWHQRWKEFIRLSRTQEHWSSGECERLNICKGEGAKGQWCGGWRGAAGSKDEFCLQVNFYPMLALIGKVPLEPC